MLAHGTQGPGQSSPLICEAAPCGVSQGGVGVGAGRRVLSVARFPLPFLFSILSGSGSIYERLTFELSNCLLALIV